MPLISQILPALTKLSTEPRVVVMLCLLQHRHGVGGEGERNANLTPGEKRGDKSTPLIGMLAPLIGADGTFDENI